VKPARIFPPDTGIWWGGRELTESADNDAGPVAAPVKKQPSKLRVRLGLTLAFIFLGFSLYGIYGGGLVPSDEGTGAEFLGAGLGAVFGVMVARRPVRPTDRHPWLQVPMFRVPFLILIMAMLFYAAIGRGMPAMFTQVFGSPGERVVTVDHWRSSGSRTCSGPQLVEEPWLSQVICLDSSYKQEMADGTKLIVHGKVSIFGIAVGTVAVDADGASTQPASESADQRGLEELSFSH